ncbi:GTPase ObgE [Candidatus Woesebacteria bacterium]|nr:GTPase ObgE [Candidatus Woesebacteria bacterium]
MLVDDVTITVKAGDGGNGMVAFFPNRRGPCGGDGGDGGDIVITVDPHRSDLRAYTGSKRYKAQNGGRGMSFNKDGKAGESLMLYVPLHTTVHITETGKTHELDSADTRFTVARGGHGGKGNAHFATSTNRAPRKAETGTPGEEHIIHLELKLIADIGLIGLPNAGKSTLLNTLTAADSRVAPYPFTTLEPHLGALHTTIIADIPGLIEGASKGKGLGHAFLKHIEKVRVLFHCISCESSNLLSDFNVIRKEIEQYSTILGGKKEVILLTKSDLLNEQEIAHAVKTLSTTGKTVYPVSVIDDRQLEHLKKYIQKNM